MKIIAAMSENRVIGQAAGMPWNVPEEYEQYLEFVRGATVLMGRRSFEIFGADVTAAHIVVLSHSSRPATGATVCQNLPEALDAAKAFGKPIFSCGGAEVYQQTIPLVTEMLLSTIKGEYEGDTYFPEFDAFEWKVAEERNEERYLFRRWVRR
ncbi:dihydrofolate reductase [Aeoliella sp. ICT_H6.2]|uniref:dihydrofolate reductase n=1 Tax=Aeoliella straminimaris TaxID=2954799 RepID=A0A9X2FJL0_9BACT|nr:dihydrofolate reductase [Aeoliella straminimaris]MCO6047386.1 dihydrofolate reductase [Aeoliella straminimaris]